MKVFSNSKHFLSLYVGTLKNSLNVENMRANQCIYTHT